MLGGAYYIWIMLAFFLATVGLILLFASIFYVGHWINKSETGEKHGFLELPDNLKPPADPPPDNPAPPQ